jgi:hypothetical protein
MSSIKAEALLGDLPNFSPHQCAFPGIFLSQTEMYMVLKAAVRLERAEDRIEIENDVVMDLSHGYYRESVKDDLRTIFDIPTLLRELASGKDVYVMTHVEFEQPGQHDNETTHAIIVLLQATKRTLEVLDMNGRSTTTRVQVHGGKMQSVTIDAAYRRILEPLAQLLQCQYLHIRPKKCFNGKTVRTVKDEDTATRKTIQMTGMCGTYVLWYAIQRIMGHSNSSIEKTLSKIHVHRRDAMIRQFSHMVSCAVGFSNKRKRQCQLLQAVQAGRLTSLEEVHAAGYFGSTTDSERPWFDWTRKPKYATSLRSHLARELGRAATAVSTGSVRLRDVPIVLRGQLEKKGWDRIWEEVSRGRMSPGEARRLVLSRGWDYQ